MAINTDPLLNSDEEVGDEYVKADYGESHRIVLLEFPRSILSRASSSYPQQSGTTEGSHA